MHSTKSKFFFTKVIKSKNAELDAQQCYIKNDKLLKNQMNCTTITKATKNDNMDQSSKLCGKHWQ
jgi:hypothetical protein